MAAASGRAAEDKRIKAMTYTKEAHQSCQKSWPKPCDMSNDKNGDLFQCLTQPKLLPKYSDQCFGILMEIGLWAPTNCKGDPIAKVCSKAMGAFRRLDCAAYYYSQFPEVCHTWTLAAGRVAKEYRNRTHEK